MKSAELLMNFLRHDTEKIPLYGFVLQKERFVPKENTAPVRDFQPVRRVCPFRNNLAVAQYRYCMAGGGIRLSPSRWAYAIMNGKSAPWA